MDYSIPYTQYFTENIYSVELVVNKNVSLLRS